MTKAALMLCCLLAASCGGSRKAKARPPLAPLGSSQEGIASWYGEPHHGRRAANGEIYDMNQFTAAHPWLPFETWLSVRNLSNRRSTEVRVTDRGPFIKGRIIDLSRAAAREIELIGPGTAKVRITVIAPPKAQVRGREYTVQVTSASDRERAERVRDQLSKSYKDVYVRYRKPVKNGNSAEGWRIVVGRRSKIEDAQRTLLEVRDRFPNAFILPWDVE